MNVADPKPSARPRAVVLLSGGLDSSTVLAMAQEQGFECYALSFAYGQRHAHELQAAAAVAKALRAARHVVATIDLRFATMMNALNLPLRDAHDALNDAVMTGLAFIKLRGLLAGR